MFLHNTKVDIARWMEPIPRVAKKQFMANFICIVKTMVSADGAYTEDNEYVYGECYRYIVEDIVKWMEHIQTPVRLFMVSVIFIK